MGCCKSRDKEYELFNLNVISSNLIPDDIFTISVLKFQVQLEELMNIIEKKREISHINEMNVRHKLKHALDHEIAYNNASKEINITLKEMSEKVSFDTKSISKKKKKELYNQAFYIFEKIQKEEKVKNKEEKKQIDDTVKRLENAFKFSI